MAAPAASLSPAFDQRPEAEFLLRLVFGGVERAQQAVEDAAEQAGPELTERRRPVPCTASPGLRPVVSS